LKGKGNVKKKGLKKGFFLKRQSMERRGRKGKKSRKQSKSAGWGNRRIRLGGEEGNGRKVFMGKNRIYGIGRGGGKSKGKLGGKGKNSKGGDLVKGR